MIIADYVDGPYEGVSQTPPQLRLAGACQAMEDCLPAIPNGVSKRPPFTWVKKLTSNGLASGSALVIDVPRGDPSLDATMILSKESGSIVARLFRTSTMAPLTLTVTTAAQTYLNLNAPTPKSGFRATSVEDVTFITNRTVAVADTGTTATARPFEAILWVKAAQYGNGFFVTVTPHVGSPVSASFATGTGATAADTPSLDTSGIAKALFDGTDPDAGHDAVSATHLNALISQGFTVTLSGPTIYIAHPSIDFSIATADGQGNTAMVAIKGEANAFSDLPVIAVNGFVVKIDAETAGGFSDYWVAFDASSSALKGVWKEVIAPGAPLGLEPTTMPIGMSVTGSPGAETWTLDTLPWTGRTVGDLTTSPDPPFIGDQITDVKWWRGRLELIANGSVMLSASDSPYKFYASTLVTQLDSDALDFLSPEERKTMFKAGLTFDLRNVIFAHRCQAVISAGGPVAPDAVRIDLMSDTDFSDQVVPQGSNHHVYYAALRSNALAIYELAIDRLSGLALPQNKTLAVPSYIPATIDTAATELIDYMTLYGSSGLGQIYVHIYRYTDFQAVQNSFSRWNLPTGWGLAGFYFKSTVLYALLVDSSSNYHWATLDVSPGTIDDGAAAAILTNWDMRVKDTSCTGIAYSAATNQTTYTLPYPVAASIQASVRAPLVVNGYPEGYLPQIASHTTTTVVLKGNWTAYSLWFGYPYNSQIVQSKWYYRGQDQRPQHAGRLSLKKMRLDLANFGGLSALVQIDGRADRTMNWSGLYMNDPQTPFNLAPSKATQTLSVPIGGNAEETTITLSNNTHLGFRLLGIEWQADWNPSARRVT